MASKAAQKALDEAISEAERKVQRELLRRIAAGSERELRSIFEEMAPEIRRQLRAVSYTEAQVARILQEVFQRTFEARVKQIESAVEAGGKAGAGGAERAHGVAFGEDAPPFVRSPRKTRE